MPNKSKKLKSTEQLLENILGEYKVDYGEWEHFHPGLKQQAIDKINKHIKDHVSEALLSAQIAIDLEIDDNCVPDSKVILTAYPDEKII